MLSSLIYERDSWDEWLNECRDEDNGWIVAFALLTSLIVWLTRRILWVLMIIGHAVSCVLLRQMEYDADKYESRLAGSDVFESSSRRIVELSLADQLMKTTIVNHFARAGLPDNLPL